MVEKERAQRLKRKESWHTYVWQDGPDTFYPNHMRAMESAHIILSGEMTLTVNGRTETYRAGSRWGVPEGTVHSARMGPQGCRYLTGERQA